MIFKNAIRIEVVAGVTYNALGNKMTEEFVKLGTRDIRKFACELFGGVTLFRGLGSCTEPGEDKVTHEQTRSFVCMVTAATTIAGEEKLQKSIDMFADVVKGALAQSRVSVKVSSVKHSFH